MLCPFCKEEVQEGAVKCKHCGSMLTTGTGVPPVSQIISNSLPPYIQKWNWAAFLWGPIWAIAHSVWIGLLTLTPFVGFIMSFVLGIKGSQWAWEKGNYTSVEEFQLRQKKWVKVWLMSVGFLLLLGIFLAIMIPQYKAYQQRKTEYVPQQQQDQAKSVQNTTQEAEEWIDKGNSLYNESNYSGAIEAYNKAIELNPQDEYAYFNRGAAYSSIDRNQEAIRDYDKAIELNPQYGKAYFYRGDVYAHIGDAQQQTDNYKIAAQLGHEEAQAQLKKAGIEW